jgi:CheY-like chemotaxis protein
MYHKLAFSEFLDTLYDSVQRGWKGTVYFISDSEGWGKVVLEDAGNLLLEYRKKFGHEALAELEGLKEVLFYQQPSRDPSGAGAGGKSRPQMLLKTDAFFNHFHLDVAPLTQLKEGRISAETTAGLEQLAETALAKAQAGSKKVLVVDDSSVARKAARFVLEGAGYRVVEAWDGFEALGQLQNEYPHLVLLDLVMPGMDGYEVLKLIRANNKFSQIPVIILTSRDTLFDKLKGKLSGTNEYLTKPYKGDELLRLVRKFL